MSHLSALAPALTLLLLCRIVAATGAGNVTTDANGYASPWVLEPDGRGTWNIIYSSVFTMVLCAWSALHLNVPAPNMATRSIRIARSLRWVIGSLLVPEAVLLNAIGQWRLMRKFRKDLNAIAARQPKKAIAEGEQPAPDEVLVFSTQYAWFAVMGGFAADISSMHNDVELATLSTSGILFLAEQGHFCRISDEEIADKSKADSIAKSLVAIQVFWFVCQALQRLAASLPLTLLEFHTLVNVGAAVATYTLWFNKPLNVYTPKRESGPELEEMLAVLLFQHSIPNRPHLCLTRRPEDNTLSWESESDLWCWNRSAGESMILVQDLDIKSCGLIELAVPHDVQIWPCTTEGHAPTRIFPMPQQTIVRTLTGSASVRMEADCATVDAQGIAERCLSHRDSLGPFQQLTIGLTAKDLRRIELVNKYVMRHTRDENGRRRSGPQEVKWKRTLPQHQFWGNRPQAHHASTSLFTGTHCPGKSCASIHEQESPAQHSPTETSSSYRESATVHIELREHTNQDTDRLDIIPESKVPLANVHCKQYRCRGHSDTEHISVDELSCFPHNTNAGLLEYSKDWTTHAANTIEIPFFMETAKLNSTGKRLCAKDMLLWSLVTVMLCSTGALHLIPVFVGFNFPSRVEYLLWSISCYVILSPIVAFVAFMLVERRIGQFSLSRPSTESLPSSDRDWDLGPDRDWNRDLISGKPTMKGSSIFMKMLPELILLTIFGTYVGMCVWARGVLLLQSFITLKKQKGEIFLTPSWNWLNYIPHI